MIVDTLLEVVTVHVGEVAILVIPLHVGEVDYKVTSDGRINLIIPPIGIESASTKLNVNVADV